MRRLWALLLWGLALLSPLAQGMNGVIYQPQLRDMSVSDDRWQKMMGDLRRAGIDTLVIQWTRYGDGFWDDPARQWLADKARIARAAGLQLVVGLHADPDFFNRQNQPLPALENYLNHLRAVDVATARQWLQLLGAAQIGGWYISSEIDDLRWRDEQAQRLAQQWLSDTRLSLDALAVKPVAVSSFFAGNMSPQGYQRLVNTLRASGVSVWVQDGAGSGKLTPQERNLYLAGQADGTVVELFREDRSRSGFHATPLDALAQQRLLSEPPRAGRQRLFFSLRYMPLARGVLEY
ncbi:DUF4434 domain-containing protein [Entomohabitans teleogrylli]|uniref:DUF4434 domain-containing protein n=1 Tax=Entomohabitans teleogrylli TaxID=1384589 RepID=UPI00073D8160|nr:DUF4434 domain-containing protein [Entomohabitans teleogrylli]